MARKILPLFLLFSLTMCATLNVRQEETALIDIIGLINDGDGAGLAERSRTPFLLDGEIVMMSADMRALWNNLAASGFGITGAVVTSVERTGKETYREFSPAMEVEVFFRKYVPPTAVVSHISSNEGEYIFLTARGRGNRTLLYGFKGPVL
ncbi:MAG: hypothetical protein JW881_08360 [Spirochaetales bacterium]|nr:hypothetical protein [Spirochaetales bacterium]